jgi:lipoprotein-anchoring transpeptidase ErfK/SrfK
MHQTRRSLAPRLLGALAALPALVSTRDSASQAVPAPELDIRALLQRARRTVPAGNARGRAALDRTLERFDDLGLNDLGLGTGVGRLVLVNIAAAELVAYDSGREVLRSRLVVGAARTRTPQLATFVTTVRSNPPWYVPASIEPEIRAAGAVGFRVVNGRLIQPPGPTNPLGPLRIGLLDSDGIFLHGTSSPGLFARQDRALSHGCVRVERVRDLAAWILGTTPAAMATTLASGRTIDLVPPGEVVVVLAYLTAWPDAAGRVVTYGDPYGLDAPGSRRAPYRRVPRPLAQTPAEADAPARVAAPEDNPL